MKINILGNDLGDMSKIAKDEYIKIIADDNSIKLYTVINNVEILKNIEGEILEDGTIIINPIILNLIPNEKITITDNEIKCENSTINYDSFDDVDLSFKSFDKAQVLVYKLTSEKRKEILDIKYALPKNSYRPILENICLNENYAVALDGYRIATRITDFNLNQEILIPLKVVKILSKLKGEGSICKQDKNIIFQIGDYSVRFYHSDEKYIAFKSLIPEKQSLKLNLDSKNILSVLKKAIKLSNGYTSTSTFSLCNTNDNALAISVERLDIKFKEKIVKSSCNGELVIGFNMKYLIDSFKHFQGDISMEFENAFSPVLLKSENKLDLLLPVRLAK